MFRKFKRLLADGFLATYLLGLISLPFVLVFWLLLGMSLLGSIVSIAAGWAVLFITTYISSEHEKQKRREREEDEARLRNIIREELDKE